MGGSDPTQRLHLHGRAGGAERDGQPGGADDRSGHRCGAPAAHLRDMLVAAGGPGPDRRGSRQAVLGGLTTSVAGWLLHSGDGSGRSTSSLACRPATCGNTALRAGSKIGYWLWWASRAAASRTCWSATRPRGYGSEAPHAEGRIENAQRVRSDSIGHACSEAPHAEGRIETSWRHWHWWGWSWCSFRSTSREGRIETRYGEVTGCSFRAVPKHLTPKGV